MKGMLAAAILFALFALIVGATRIKADADIDDALSRCMTDPAVIRPFLDATSPDEWRAARTRAIDCIERHRSFVAGLYYDRDKVRILFDAEFEYQLEVFTAPLRKYRPAPGSAPNPDDP